MSASLEARVRAELLHMVFSDQRLSLIAAFVFSVTIAGIVAQVEDVTFPAVWVSGMTISLAIRYLTAERFLQLHRKARDLKFWATVFLIQCSVTGVFWGWMGYQAYASDSQLVRNAVMLLLAGVTAAAGRTLACHFPALVTNATLSVTPLLIQLFRTEGDGATLFASLYTFYLLLMIALGRSFRDTVAKSFRLQLENADLARQLREDMAAREAAEVALRSSEERLQFAQVALDHAQDLVAIVDRDGKLLHVSAALCRYTGRSEQELAQRKIWDGIMGSTAASFVELWDAVKRAGASTFEQEVIGQSGERMPVEVNATYVELDGREAICAIARDIAPRRAAEDEKRRLHNQLQETQRLESLGVLAGGIAHDFNNLLTAILGNASLAREYLDKPQQVAELLGQVETAANQAAGLCRQMLAYAGRGQLRVESLDLPAIVSDSARLLEMTIGRRARLELNLRPALPGIMADTSQIRQVVLNLVHNAAESINHASGLIAVSTEAVRIDATTISTARVRSDITPGDGVRLNVRDNGAGMDAATLERIFEPFFTTKFTGRGLGLPAVLGIVRSHRALLHVESTPGHGSTFRVTFAASKTAPAPRKLTAPPVRPFQGGYVLVVDDEESVRGVASHVLERLGFTVELAADADTGLRLLSTNPERFTLLLIDLTMPGTDGAAMFAELRRRGVKAPAIFMSGHSDEQVRQRVGPDPRCGFLHKPFDLAALREKVYVALNPKP